MSHASDGLTIAALIDIVGEDTFDIACAEAMSDGTSVRSSVPHDLSGRLWFEGDESVGERLEVAAELYRRMPCYANLMYWPYDTFDERTRARMWDVYQAFLEDPRDAVAHPIAYSLWVDFFEDPRTVDRAWREVAGPQEPRRPRLERVVSASGPVAWARKASLYEQLAAEGGWDEPLIAGLYGSCVDVYGSLDRLPALRILRRVRASTNHEVYRILEQALEDPGLPQTGVDRRAYVAELLKKDQSQSR